MTALYAILPLWCKRISLAVTVLCCSSSLHAQNDSIIYADTLIRKEIRETTTETRADTVTLDVDDMDEEEEEEEPFYFRKNSESPVPPPLYLRKLPDSALQHIRQDEEFWYADSVFRNGSWDDQSTTGAETNHVPPPPQRTTVYASPERNSTFRVFLWIFIVAGFLAFLFFYLNSMNVGLFRKRSRSVQEEVMEEESEDIFAINYQRDIEKAAAAGNYRFAIRLMFLRALKNMAEKNIIQYKSGATNFDYLLQVNSSKYYADFFRLTRNYEYSWYGKFDVSKEAYTIIKKDFDNFSPTTH